MEIPECLSIMICDEIIRDERTGKVTLVGVFSSVFVPEVPCQHPRMWAFFSLTNGKGDYDLSLRVEHERAGATVMEIRGPLKLTDPLEIADFYVELRGLPLPEAGKYWIFLTVNGEIIKQRPFLVCQRTERT
ncbi:MAG: hypothetical protein AMXMBFR83_24210 [Phycisphaerae bacterium]